MSAGDFFLRASSELRPLHSAGCLPAKWRHEESKKAIHAVIFAVKTRTINTAVPQSHFSVPIRMKQGHIFMKQVSSEATIIINPLSARVVWAPQMILQQVFSIFPCSSLPSGICRTPGPDVVFLPLPLSVLSSSPFHSTWPQG